MAVIGGYISLHRKILKWEWFRDSATFHTFIYLLLSANYEPGMFKGMRIERGQVVTSIPKICEDCQQTIQQTRTAIKHLQLTGEITDKATPHYRIITIVRYDEYQQANRQSNGQLTDNQQTNQQTNQQQYNNINNNNKRINNNNPSLSRREIFKPPTVEEVERYCEEKGVYGFDAQYFIDYYGRTNWILKNGQKVRDWKACVRTWLRNDEKKRQQEEDERNPLPY